jgi:DNA polymerase IV
MKPEPGRTILHLDVDAFLASVEQAVHPELRGQAVVVGGAPTDRNLVMSCSYEARRFGLRPGMMLAEAARRCPHAIFRRGDSQAANRLREETAQILRRASPLVEVASIDDFFVELTGAVRHTAADGLGPRRGQPTALEVAGELRAAIRREVELPVTIGIANSRMLARIAGKLGKPGGIAQILPGYEAAFLARMPVEHLPGVGHSIGNSLERFGIRTAGDLRQVSREVLFASFGRLGLVLSERARGIDPEPVEPTYLEDEHGQLRVRMPQTIRRDSTFEPEEGRREIVEAMLAYIVERAAYRLRSHGANAGSLELRVQYVDTRPTPERGSEEEPGASATLARRSALGTPTDSTEELWSHARALYRELPRRRALTKRIGITLIGLRPRVGWQGHLFSDPARDLDSRSDPKSSAGTHPTHRPTSYADRQRALDQALDRLRAKHGFGRVLRGAYVPLVKTHRMNRDGFVLRTPSLNQ